MRLADLTTLRVGGEARELRQPATRDELVDTARGIWAQGDEWVALGGGSNVLVADAGFDGCVIHAVTRGIVSLNEIAAGGHQTTPLDEGDGHVTLRVEAGEPWDDLVALTVERGLTGIEALSGIPGSTGAAPIQNIGAYGQELSDTLVAVDFLDYDSGDLVTLRTDQLGLGYRTSAMKQGRRGLVISADIRLTDARGLGAPVVFEQLAGALGVPLGTRVPLADIRQRVLELRSSKGMVLDASDPDSVSAGSFFTNPIVARSFAVDLPATAPRFEIGAEDARLKLSAAWLIERAGIHRGFSLPGSRAAISSKHTLAIGNRGGATAAQIAELARFMQERVRNEFGVTLHPEPVYVGF